MNLKIVLGVAAATLLAYFVYQDLTRSPGVKVATKEIPYYITTPEGAVFGDRIVVDAEDTAVFCISSGVPGTPIICTVKVGEIIQVDDNGKQRVIDVLEADVIGIIGGQDPGVTAPGA